LKYETNKNKLKNIVIGSIIINKLRGDSNNTKTKYRIINLAKILKDEEEITI